MGAVWETVMYGVFERATARYEKCSMECKQCGKRRTFSEKKKIFDESS